MTWEIRVELTLEHGYYAPAAAPLVVRPADPRAFDRAGLLLRQSGARVLIVSEDGNRDLPASVTLDLDAANSDVISVTSGGDWRRVPLVTLPEEGDRIEADLGLAAPEAQVPGRMRLAQIAVPLAPEKGRKITLAFAPVASHWAYHVIGPGSDDVRVEDPEGEVDFDAVGVADLPDGTSARVIRSRAPLPARARPEHRFSLSRPGPFGPRTLIPVLPAPKPQFAHVPGPDGSDAIIQSDVYVTIF